MDNEAVDRLARDITLAYKANDDGEFNEALDAMRKEIVELKAKHTRFVTHVRVACTCLSAPLFLDQEGRSDVHEAARQTLKYLREAVENDQGEET